jgi:hypothetical protein
MRDLFAGPRNGSATSAADRVVDVYEREAAWIRGRAYRRSRRVVNAASAGE